jgi:uncharacterized protein YcfJ
MAFFRLVLNFVIAFALVGVLTTTLVYPRYKAWDNTPGIGTALCNCADVTRQTADGLISAQMSGCAAGAVSGALVGAIFGWRRRKATAALAPAKP